MKLKGFRCFLAESDRIRVYVRIRPRNAEELDRGEANGIDVELDRTEVMLMSLVTFGYIVSGFSSVSCEDGKFVVM